MENKEYILLIKKYFNGELDNKAMQELEEKALDDPFLAEAMEGFEFSAPDDTVFKELDEHLNQRIEKDKRKILVFSRKNWYIAASAIFLIGLAGVFLILQKQENQVLITKNPVISSAVEEKVSDSLTAEEDKLDIISKSPEIAIQQTPKPAVPPAVEKLQIASIQEAEMVSDMDYSEMSSVNMSVKTRVNAEPSQGVKLSITDTNEVNIVGYAPVRRNDLTSAVSSVSSYETNDFKEYLAENNKLKIGEKGIVVVSFIINKKGKPTKIKIIKSLSPEADAKTIELIKGYTGWQYKNNGKTEIKEISIEFN